MIAPFWVFTQPTTRKYTNHYDYSKRENAVGHKFSLLQMTDLFENYPFEAVCAQLKHFPSRLRRGKTLPPAMTGCRRGGRRAFVLVGGRTSPAATASQTPQSALTDSQGFISGLLGGKTVEERNLRFPNGATEIRIFRGAIARRESRRSLAAAAVLCGVGRGVEWRSANTLI